MKTPEISRRLTGGILVSDAAGHYPGLELFNYIYGCSEGILPSEGSPRFVRAGQDFARRLVWDPDYFASRGLGDSVFVGDEAALVLAHLLKCLQLRVPDRGSTNWEAAHFFPYTRSLIHWDARNARSSARGEVQIERRYLRGGGALAFKVLRNDPVPERRQAVVDGFRDLMPDDRVTALEKLSAVLSRRGGSTYPGGPCDIEAAAEPRQDKLDDFYRSGVECILSHRDLSSTARIRAVVNWTGFWLALCQRDRSATKLGSNPPEIVIDCGSGPSQLRRESGRVLKEVVSLIGQAAQECLPKGEELKTKARRDLAGFFTRTCAWIGLLNAFSGKRHFVISLDLLEALVLAHVRVDTEMSYENFIERVLNEKYRLVIGREAAASAGLLNRLDASIFEDNEDAFAKQLITAGLMHAYSDATRMVGTRALK